MLALVHKYNTVSTLITSTEEARLLQGSVRWFVCQQDYSKM